MIKDLTIWDERWNSLNATLTELVQDYQETDFPRKATLYRLVERLQKFAETQFSFFYDGFGAQEHFILDPSDEYPPEYALSVILSQVAYDLEVIQRAAAQRISDADALRKTLDTADKLAGRALWPAKESNLVGQRTTVITYFQKSTSIRLIPYAPVALIGIPLSVTTIERDYLAIPHEIGHYVFRHGELDLESLSAVLLNRLPKEPAWCYNWVEEIFADVYGCLIGGPVMALDFQDLQLEYPRKEFTRDDGEHPTPAVRPDIYHRMLQKMNLPHWSERLGKRWKGRLNRRGLSAKFRPPDSAPTDLELCSTVEVVINEVMGHLSGVEIERWSGSTDASPPDGAKQPGAGGPQQPDDDNNDIVVGGLYREFNKDRIQALVSGVEVDELQEEDPAPISRPWTYLIKTKLQDPQPSRLVFPPEVWLPILDADGWTTKGPNSRK